MNKLEKAGQEYINALKRMKIENEKMLFIIEQLTYGDPSEITDPSEGSPLHPEYCKGNNLSYVPF